MKTCKKCKIEKQTSNFYKHSGMTDGYLSHCKDCKRKYSVNYYSNNKDKVKKYQEIPKVRAKKIERKRQWDIDNKEYNAKNRHNNKSHRNEQRRERYKNDPEYRILGILRNRLFCALNGTCKSASTLKLLGCSIKELKEHLESLFQPGMTWDNQGKWHMDHIRPCISFDLTDPSQQRKCFNYINLQPLWAEDNLKKAGENYFNNYVF